MWIALKWNTNNEVEEDSEFFIPKIALIITIGDRENIYWVEIPNIYRDHIIQFLIKFYLYF